jgi:NAD+ synthase (glutamine-hydrolysing)
VTALLVHVLGPANVTAVSMPSRFNGPTTLGITGQIASSLGVELVTVPIQEMVDQLALATGVTPGDFAYENVQARARMQILATLSQKRGALFTCNGNKVEIAFGYSTLYGDQSGAIAPIGDLVKREVRQLATYLNERVFGREVIPKACIDMKPSAELSAAQSVEEGKGDPFDYGTVEARGYHDEMVRAFTEFRKGPEWFLSEYAAGRLEKTLLLPAGTLARLFPSPSDFVADLEDRWGRFAGAVFKRVQAPPIPIVSRRAFGYDLRERCAGPSDAPVSGVRQVVLARYAGQAHGLRRSFNRRGTTRRSPAARHPLRRGLPSPLAPRDKPPWVAPEHRRRMAEPAFRGIAVSSST